MTIAQRDPIAGINVPVSYDPGEDVYVVASPVTGRYRISGTLLTSFDSEVPEPLRHRLLVAVRRASEAGRLLTLDTFNVIELAETEQEAAPLDFPDRVLRLLHQRSAGRAGLAPQLDVRTEFPLIGARDPNEMEWAIGAVVDQGLATKQSYKGGGFSLTPEGWRHLRDTGIDSTQAFVAMWFDAGMTSAWTDGIQPAFKALSGVSGSVDTGWDPVRIDSFEHNDRIDARIVAEINRSGLVVADVTGGRQGVYFEAGYALGRGIPVIWTVQKRSDVEMARDMHFDTRQFSHILWKTPDDLREQLHYRILATAPRTGRPVR